MQSFNCPRCQQANSPQARFCQQCGLPFQSAPPQYQPKQPGIGTGIKIGIGIFVGFLLMMGACAACFVSSLNRSLSPSGVRAMSGDETPVGTLLLENVTHKVEHGYYKINGRVRNAGKQPVQYVKIHVEYLSSFGNVLDSDFTYATASETLEPDNSKVFTLMTPVVKGVVGFRCFIYKDWNVTGSF